MREASDAKLHPRPKKHNKTFEGRQFGLSGLSGLEGTEPNTKCVNKRGRRDMWDININNTTATSTRTSSRTSTITTTTSTTTSSSATNTTTSCTTTNRTTNTTK